MKFFKDTKTGLFIPTGHWTESIRGYKRKACSLEVSIKEVILMTELTPTLFEDIFFGHIRSMTVGHSDEILQKRLASFDYQFSDHWLNHESRRKKP